MTTLSFFLNCITLLIAFRGTSSMPQNAISDGHIGCPFQQVPSNLNWPIRYEQWALLQTRNMLVNGMMCACNYASKGPSIRDDYRYTPGIGSHKLHTRALTWNEARKRCNQEGGHLAIINSNAEEHVLMELFNQSGPLKGADIEDEAFLGTHDLYAEGDWVTVLGDPLAKTGYARWTDKWGGQPDNGGGRQNCGALLREGAMDDVQCEIQLAFFCEIPDIVPL